MCSFLRAARRILDDDMSVIRRETEETLSLLKDTAQKHMQVESSKGGLYFYLFDLYNLNYLRLGLVIVEASYGPSEQDSGTKDLIMDVTIALQALVHNSQVYIAGHRTKVSQGHDRTLYYIHTYIFAVRYTGLL